MSGELAFPTRRLLLAGLGVSAVGAAAAPVLSLKLAPSGSVKAASWWDRMFVSLAQAGYSEWSGLVGETFTLGTNTGDRALRVAAVEPFAQSGARPTSLGRARAFAVVFESGAGGALPGGDVTFQITHRSFPPLPIFMGRSETVGRISRLVAVFN